MITNTHSVGTVRDSFLEWEVGRRKSGTTPAGGSSGLPIVAETYDAFLK